MWLEKEKMKSKNQLDDDDNEGFEGFRRLVWMVKECVLIAGVLLVVGTPLYYIFPGIFPINSDEEVWWLLVGPIVVSVIAWLPIYFWGWPSEWIARAFGRNHGDKK